VEISVVLCGFAGKCSKNAAFFRIPGQDKYMRSEKFQMIQVICEKHAEFFPLSAL
jgi:hypothetical protein